MISSLQIQVNEQSGKTILENCFFNPPFKVANVTEDKSLPMLHLMLMSASPGILEADDYTIKIEVGENASLRLHTQAYQRIYTMQQQAKQFTTIHVGKNAAFWFIPHPVVPHKNASFISDAKIYLEENASLIYGEIINCGRKLNGEVFLFSKYHSRTSVFYKGKLVLKENLLLQPSKMKLAGIGQLQQFTHQATMVFLKQDLPVNDIKEKILMELGKQENISFGVTKTAFNGLMIRILGQQAEQLFDCLTILANQISDNLKPQTTYAV
ncbi:MAG: urease accessory protein UreD [Rhizobacter sp.]|nr:urease accessory protein UreD [Ferruginibacter sp.]